MAFKKIKHIQIDHGTRCKFDEIYSPDEGYKGDFLDRVLRGYINDVNSFKNLERNTHSYTNMAISEDLHRELKHKSLSHGISLQKIVSLAVNDYHLRKKIKRNDKI